MNNKPLISVIVPIYNAEHYLKDCIISIINQTIYDLEIILINDGSTDKSGEICDHFSSNDRRIISIHQANLGVSAARNKGLQVAKGKYIAFVDSDDILPKDAYENLLKLIKEDHLVIGQVQMISEDGKLQNYSSFGKREMSQEEFLKELFLEKKLPYLGYPVDKLYFRHIIEKNHLRFNEKIRLNEDRLFVLTYLIHCKGAVFCKDVVYYYRQRSEGIIISTRRNTTVTNSEMTVLKSFQEMQKICRDYSDELYFICSRKAFESALDLLNRVSKDDREKQKVLKSFLRNNSRICLANPQYNAFDRIKIITHTVLKR